MTGLLLLPGNSRFLGANILWAHFMLACERVSGKEGAHGSEHPEDRAVIPFRPFGALLRC